MSPQSSAAATPTPTGTGPSSGPMTRWTPTPSSTSTFSSSIPAAGASSSKGASATTRTGTPTPSTSHGADFSIGIRAQEFFHIQEHKEYAPDFETPAPGFGSVHVVGSDADPGKEYYSDFSEFTGEFKVRVPSYPAHVRGDARLYKKEGPNQLRYFSRNCATHICHSNSRTRDIDQETQEYNIGFDAHVGFVDVVYNRNFLSFEDKADDPMDFFGPFFLGRASARHVPPPRQSRDRVLLRRDQAQHQPHQQGRPRPALYRGRIEKQRQRHHRGQPALSSPISPTRRGAGTSSRPATFTPTWRQPTFRPKSPPPARR